MIYIYQILMIAASYIIGSIPTAYIVVRIVKGIDIRQYGSGNVGATNVLRVLGKAGFVVTLTVDILKGFLPVFFLPVIFQNMTGGFSHDIVQILCVVAVIFGHTWTIFLGFKGGKGVATSTGAFFALVPDVMSFTALTWFIVIFASKYVSLSSIISALVFSILLFVLKKSLIIKIFGILLASLVIIRHKENIQRLASGTERKIGEKVDLGEKKK